MRLTASLVRAARPRARLYALYDGLGLCLQVTPSGSKWWRYRYRFARREKMISLGVYPKVSLSEARLLHADARGMLARGVDPSAERNGRRTARLITFNVVARSWLTTLEPLVRTGRLTADTVTDSRRLLERHILPDLGSKPILEISSRDLLLVLKTIEIRGLRHTARRAKQRCSRVFRHAVALGYVARDVTEDLRGMLEPPVVRRRPCITEPRRLGELLRAVDGYTGRPVTRIGLQLAPLLFVRPGELRRARWCQFDFEIDSGESRPAQ